ncbi:MAG: Ribosomal protein [Chloroflexota bacterium]|nr:Ribosomal protein [Chloroflexota bacterium]
MRSALRTFVKKARTEIEKPTEEGAALAAVQLAAKRLDQAASKGIIHKNQAARRKSRLMHQLNKLQQAPAEDAAAAKPVRRAAARTTGGAARTRSTASRATGTTRITTRRTTKS